MMPVSKVDHVTRIGTESKIPYIESHSIIGVYPPIEKMDGPFHLLVNCEKFSLSTNMISNINNLQAFKTLKVLSLGRNVIKNLQVRTKLFLEIKILKVGCVNYLRVRRLFF